MIQRIGLWILVAVFVTLYDVTSPKIGPEVAMDHRWNRDRN